MGEHAIEGHVAGAQQNKQDVVLDPARTRLVAEIHHGDLDANGSTEDSDLVGLRGQIRQRRVIPSTAPPEGLAQGGSDVPSNRPPLSDSGPAPIRRHFARDRSRTGSQRTKNPISG